MGVGQVLPTPMCLAEAIVKMRNYILSQTPLKMDLHCEGGSFQSHFSKL